MSVCVRAPTAHRVRWRAYRRSRGVWDGGGVEAKLFGRPSDGVEVEEIIVKVQNQYTAACTHGLNHLIYAHRPYLNYSILYTFYKYVAECTNARVT